MHSDILCFTHTQCHTHNATHTHTHTQTHTHTHRHTHTHTQMRRAKALARTDPLWMRVSIDNSKVRHTLGFHFRTFDDTLTATVHSLVDVGGVVPLAWGWCLCLVDLKVVFICIVNLFVVDYAYVVGYTCMNEVEFMIYSLFVLCKTWTRQRVLWDYFCKDWIWKLFPIALVFAFSPPLVNYEVVKNSGGTWGPKRNVNSGQLPT